MMETRVFRDDLGEEYEGPYWFGPIIDRVVELIEAAGAMRNLRLDKSQYGSGHEIDVLVRESGVAVEMDMGKFDLHSLFWPRDGGLWVWYELRSFQFAEEGGPDTVDEGERVFPVTRRDEIALKLGATPPVVHDIVEYLQKG
jgi:hypothetical protein